MTPPSFPLDDRILAEMFAPLTTARRGFRHDHLEPLRRFVQHLRFQGADRNLWLRRVTAALSLLERGFQNHPTTVAPVIYETSVRLGPVEMEIGQAVTNAVESTQKADPDERFQPILVLYSRVYERYYPLLAAPLIVADAALSGRTESLVEADGRVSMRSIERMETSQGYPQGLLSEGRNRHIRNSFSHGRYQVLSGDEITMEDCNSRGATTWGPETFRHQSLLEIALTFHLTSEALLAAIILFDVSNGATVEDRNFAPRGAPRQLRSDLLREAISLQAAECGFTCTQVREEGSVLEVRLRTAHAEIDGERQIYVAGSVVRHYTRMVRTEHVPIWTQVLRLLQLISEVTDHCERVSVEVAGPDETTIGHVVAAVEVRRRIARERLAADEARKLLDEDTLSEEAMPLIDLGMPRPA